NDAWSRVPAEQAAPKVVEPEKPEKRAACPPEYLCPLCRKIFDKPSISRCCGRSACSKCFEERRSDSCALCSKQWDIEQPPVPNLRLAEIVGSLDL
ncbi:unnamed protein product, partial [Polarella glacialis]